MRYIVLEKELRQKELMKMMSVKESDIGWSWFMTFFMLHIFTAIGAAAVSSQLYDNSAAGLLWIYWEFALLSVITFTFFLASFFSKATLGTIICLIVFFGGYILTSLVDYQDGDPGLIALVSLHPVGVFSFGLQEIGRLEDLGVGLTASTLSSTDSPSGYTFQNTISSFIFDCIFWGVLAWYSNRVVSSGYGRPLPWYFPFTTSYWLPSTARAPPDSDDGAEIVYDESVPVEEVSNTLKEQAAAGESIEIRGLRKTFGDKTAVDGLSMSLYNGQITALLGHNGAGM